MAQELSGREYRPGSAFEGGFTIRERGAFSAGVTQELPMERCWLNWSMGSASAAMLYSVTAFAIGASA